MASNTILVTGATGKTGRRVTALLNEHGFPVREASRHSTVPFDWNDVASWDAAIDGVRAVYLVHTGLGTPEATHQVKTFAHKAAAAGVVKAVLVSTPDDGSEFSQSMRLAESHIVAAGLALTSLRLRWFYQNFTEDFLYEPVMSGALRLPAGNGREAFVDADDIAEVAVAALTDDRHNGKFYELTGPSLLDFAQVTEAISHGAKHNLTYTAVDADTYIAEQVALGVPADWANSLSAMYQNIASE